MRKIFSHFIVAVAVVADDACFCALRFFRKDF
jgi:hypothetical protein